MGINKVIVPMRLSMGRTLEINGHTAKITSERKTVLWRVGTGLEETSVPVTQRLTPLFVQKLIEGEGFDLNQVDRVDVYHYRYVKYDLTSVMKTRSGSYSVWIKYPIKNGKLLKGIRELENRIY